MTTGDYLLGLVLLALTVAPLAAGAARVRARLLPGWHGAPARVAEAVMAIGALVVIAELLGTAGLFRAWAVVPACVAAGAGAWIWGARLPEAGGARARPAARAAAPPAPPQGRLATAIALAGCALVVVAWLDRTYFSVNSGMTDPDTLWFHIPYAARWVQDGSLTGLHFTSYEPLTTFYPSTPSLIHAIGMLAFGTEVLSPYVNLGWLALALTAGWAIGRPYGVAPATLLGSALVMGAPIIVGMQAGSAKDDAPGLALLLAALALLVNAWSVAPPRRSAVVIAGLAAGLLLGVKLSMVAPALAIGAAAIAAAPRARRLSTAGAWAAMFVLGGGFWYLRDLARTGNPAPWFEVNLGPVHLPSPQLAPYTERYVTGALSDYLTRAGFYGDHLFPSLHGAFGPVWWAVLALALGGLIGALVAGGTRLQRALGAAGLAMGIAYVLTPGGAGGTPEGVPHLVFWSMRYLSPALAVGLVCLPLVPALRRRPAWPLAAFAIALLATQFAQGVFGLWSDRPATAALLALPAAAAVLIGLRLLHRRVGRAGLAAGALAAMLVLVALGWKAQDIYFRERYTDPASPLAGAYRWARPVRDARIGIVGFYLQSPLLGEDLSNHVQYVGHDGGDGNFRSVVSCSEWRTELARGRYDYVIAAPFNYPWGASDRYPREARWTETDPSARRIQANGPVAIFKLSGAPNPTTCTKDGFPANSGGQPEQSTGPARPSS
ncbi:MAG: hypothetical protein QOE06_2867 [Thermoleophilaceae bacterium]|nr:hypothetical protein [Thermoleophilaceae bacterium]